MYVPSYEGTLAPTGSQQRHFLQAPKDVQRIRGFTTMRNINLRFNYLLTYSLTHSLTRVGVLDTRVDGPSLRVVNTTREHG